MFHSSHRTFFAPLAVLLMTACGSKAGTADSSREEHEALTLALDKVKADTGVTKTNTELLKVGLTAVSGKFSELGAKVDTSLEGLATDMATVKAGAGALQTAATSIKADTTAIKTSLDALSGSTSLSTMLVAARRYSRTCNPNTDTWLRSAWPDLTDAEITNACRRDGRWHYLGTMLDIVTGAITLPDDMEVGLTSYSRSVAPVTVNGWERGTRFCLPPIAVGTVNIVGGAALIHECISFMDNIFAVTHRQVGQTTTDASQRNYTGYSGGSEYTLPCTQGGGYTSCNNYESVASYWRIYVRQ